ncbi:MAG: CapA family protein [Muribaculaceae bacterium]|nr:CapA family protein [Muribaculaceae bacterium]
MPLPLFTGLPHAIASLILQSEAVLLFAGDAMQHKAQLDAAANGDGTYNFTECFEPIKDIVSEADFAVVNLETPLGGKPYRGYPCFSAPDSYAEALIESGFDLFLTANNHTLDARDKGLKRTVSVLDSMAVPHLGTYHDADSRMQSLPLIINIKGFKVGFLNYTYGTNGIEIQGDAVVDYIDRDVIAADIQATRRAGVEILCVAVHWGDEYKLLPNDAQRKLAKWLCDKDVDIIFGGHPHVIQPMELIDNPLTGRKTAIFYSLGNFISNMKTRDTRGGAVSRVTLKRDAQGVAYVDDLNYQLIFTVPPTDSNSNFMLYPADHKAFSSTPMPSQNGANTTCTPIPSSVRANRDAFVASATEIFKKYNKNVTEYTPAE